MLATIPPSGSIARPPRSCAPIRPGCKPKAPPSCFSTACPPRLRAPSTPMSPSAPPSGNKQTSRQAPFGTVITEPGWPAGAAEEFEARYRLRALRRQVAPILAGVDFLVTPTGRTCYPVDEVAREPVALSSRFGGYTNFILDSSVEDRVTIHPPTGSNVNIRSTHPLRSQRVNVSRKHRSRG